MGYAYGNLFGQRADAGHYYLYVPEHGSGEPLPVLVFLHGSAGNFKAYLWLWSKFAEEHGVVIIAPSFGFGNWLQDGAARSILDALEDASTVVDIDERRVILAGLSNGGLGVSQLATEAPDRFQGLIFLSPVMATDLLKSSRFLANWEGRSVLMMTGEADRRIPFAYVQRHVRLLDEAGVQITSIGYPGEDHFLVFSQPEDVLHDVSNWLSQIE